MKKILPLFCMAVCLTAVSGVNAQIRISINANIVSQPVWGPTGYDYARYYYLPDIDAYYSIPNHTFVYLEGGNWVFGESLPDRFHYDLYHGYKVVVNEPRPYLHADVYRTKYSQYRGWQGKQDVIRDSRDNRYYVIKNHPMHGSYREDEHRQGDKQAHGRGNGGEGNGNNGRGQGGGKKHGNGNDRRHHD